MATDFKLTADQERGLAMVKKLVAMPHDKPRIAILRGYAGTGKTTLIRVLGREVGDLAIIAPTGKAAIRVREASGLPASTIHRFIYAAKEDPLTGNVAFKRKDPEEISRPESGLIVIEESSMVNLAVWKDIYDVAIDKECHILCVGDPFQLPPVDDAKENAGFGLLLNDFPADLVTNMTEITRHALESPIIRASLKLRQGDVIGATMELPRVAPKNLLEAHVGVLQAGGVVICHRNVTRQELNRRIREHKKLPQKTLVDGEPLLVLRNNYQLQRFNGEVLFFDGWKKLPGRQYEIYDRFKNTVDSASFGLAYVEGEQAGLVPKAILGNINSVSPNAIELVCKTALGENIPYLHCNFGYTLTAHKSQGSEWKKVLVVVEKSVRPFSREGMRWTYTSVTRAREEVSLVWIAGQNDQQII